MGEKITTTSKKVKVIKVASPFTRAVGWDTMQLPELPLERREVGNTKQSASVGISWLCNTQWWKAFGFVYAGEGWDMLEWKPLIFLLILKGAKAQVYCLQPLTLGSSEGNVAWTAVLWGGSSVGGTGEGHGRAAVGLSVKDIPAFYGSHFAWEEQAPPSEISLIPLFL